MKTVKITPKFETDYYHDSALSIDNRFFFSPNAVVVVVVVVVAAWDGLSSIITPFEEASRAARGLNKPCFRIKRDYRRKRRVVYVMHTGTDTLLAHIARALLVRLYIDKVRCCV